jgi:hypothetical protein
MAYPVENQLVAELAREQVAQIAPQELPLFRTTSKAYFQDPEKTLQDQADKDEELGFGVEVSVVFLTPIVLEVMKVVVSFLVNEVLKSVQTESSGLIREYVKSMFKKFRPAEKEEQQKAPLLTFEQINQVHQVAFERARQLDLPEAQAQLLADSLTGSLATRGA